MPDFCFIFAVLWVSIYILTIIYFWVVIGYRSIDSMPDLSCLTPGKC